MSTLANAAFNWTDGWLLLVLVVLLVCGFMRPLRAHRSLLWLGGALVLVTAISPWRGNPLGRYLFVGAAGASHLPSELLKVLWWILGAWFLKSLLDRILRRTVFPNDNQPHARQLFADLASALIYVVAFVGIMDVVFKQPVSTVLATSGVLAIVLGLALQNTLSDVFSGLAINVERSFAAGDWIATKDGTEGQVIEVNWRATRIKTFSNDLVVIPNSVIAKATVTNHSRLDDSHVGTIRLAIHHGVSPAQVIDALQDAARKSPGIMPGSTPTAYASSFDEALINYDLTFAVSNYLLLADVQSSLILQVVASLRERGIGIGNSVVDVRVVEGGVGNAAGASAAASSVQLVAG
jgi:small-conductance mechanosensitive channel